MHTVFTSYNPKEPRILILDPKYSFELNPIFLWCIYVCLDFRNKKKEIEGCEGQSACAYVLTYGFYVHVYLGICRLKFNCFFMIDLMVF